MRFRLKVWQRMRPRIAVWRLLLVRTDRLFDLASQPLIGLQVITALRRATAAARSISAPLRTAPDGPAASPCLFILRALSFCARRMFTGCRKDAAQVDHLGTVQAQRLHRCPSGGRPPVNK